MRAESLLQITSRYVEQARTICETIVAVVTRSGDFFVGFTLHDGGGRDGGGGVSCLLTSFLLHQSLQLSVLWGKNNIFLPRGVHT